MQHDRPGSQPEEGGERSIGQSNAELSAQIGGGMVQRVQYVFFAVRLDLLAGKSFTRADVDRFQSDGVIVTQTGDRTGEQSFNAVAQTDFAADIGGDAVVVGGHVSRDVTGP